MGLIRLIGVIGVMGGRDEVWNFQGKKFNNCKNQTKKNKKKLGLRMS
jgi:hypothetical protein